MELQANPDAAHLQLYIWILIPVVVGLITLIGWFLNKIVDKVISAFESMIEAAKNLEKVFSEFKSDFMAVKTTVDLEIPTVTKRINCHADQIDGHEHRLTIIETDHEHFHKLRKPQK